MHYVTAPRCKGHSDWQRTPSLRGTGNVRRCKRQDLIEIFKKEGTNRNAEPAPPICVDGCPAGLIS